MADLMNNTSDGFNFKCMFHFYCNLYLFLRLVTTCDCNDSKVFSIKFVKVACMLLSCLVRASHRIYTLQLPQCQGTPCSKQEKWQQHDSNGIRTNNHLFCKQTLNHLAKLIKWLSFVVSTYLYGKFDCMLLSCHVHVSEWI